MEKVGDYSLLYSFTGAFASIYWHENIISVGASGAIFGLYGLILVFNLFKIYPDDMRPFTWGLAGIFVGVGLLYGFMGGIDNAAHVGGLISGFLIGAMFLLINKEKMKKNAEQP